MFKIVKDRRAWWTVQFNGVTEEGRVVTNEVELRFFIHPETVNTQLMVEAERIPDRARQLVTPDLEAAGKNASDVTEEEMGELMLEKLGQVMAEFLQRLACDWRKVGAENGDPLRFELEHIIDMVNVPGFFQAAVTAYAKCRVGLKGEKGAKEGN